MKTAEEAKAHLEQSLTFVGDRYTTAVKRADWATRASSDQAEKNFAESMSKVIAKKTRQLNTRKVSNSEWQEAAANKGGAVIADRMRASLDKQSTKWTPIYQSVSSDIARLPARTVDFRSNITNRVVGTVESWKKHSGKL
jgi:leucyl aminopeptidase (aminopeptidase T)